jgi:hypothetical protein
VHTLTAAVDHNTDAGFLPFAAAAARELAATLHLNRPGDRESAAHHSADAAALTMRINKSIVSGLPCGEGPSGLKMVVRSPADVVLPWSFEAVQ